MEKTSFGDIYCTDYYEILKFINFKKHKRGIRRKAYKDREIRYPTYQDALDDGWKLENWKILEKCLNMHFVMKKKIRNETFPNDSELQKILIQIMGYHLRYLPSSLFFNRGYFPILWSNKVILY